jgi:hypothetical protein
MGCWSCQAALTLTHTWTCLSWGKPHVTTSIQVDIFLKELRGGRERGPSQPAWLLRCDARDDAHGLCDRHVLQVFDNCLPLNSGVAHTAGQTAALAGGTTMHIDFALPVNHDLWAGWEAWQVRIGLPES